MLVLTRARGETIIVGEGPDAIEVAFLGMSQEDSKQARIGIDAPRHVPTVREELLKKTEEDEDGAR